MLITKPAEPGQEFRSSRIDSPLPLDWPDENRYRLLRNSTFDRREIIERQMPESRQQRRKADLHLLLAGCRDAGHRAAMERVLKRQDLEASGTRFSPLIVAIFSGKLDYRFICLRA